MPDLLEEAVRAAEHLERRGAFDQARAVRELVERVERLQKTGAELAEIVRSVQGHNGFVMLTQEQIAWLSKVLADVFPLAGSSINEMAATVDGELRRAALKPIPDPQPKPSESLAEWEALAAQQREGADL